MGQTLNRTTMVHNPNTNAKPALANHTTSGATARANSSLANRGSAPARGLLAGAVVLSCQSLVCWLAGSSEVDRSAPSPQGHKGDPERHQQGTGPGESADVGAS